MISRYLSAGVVAGALTLGSSIALAQGDAEAGEKVFNKCKACHVADEAQNRVGPHLVGIFGRQAGSVEGFKYSDAMKGVGRHLERGDHRRIHRRPAGLHQRQSHGIRRPEGR